MWITTNEYLLLYVFVVFCSRCPSFGQLTASTAAVGSCGVKPTDRVSDNGTDIHYPMWQLLA